MAPVNAGRPFGRAKKAIQSGRSSHLINWIRKLRSEGREYSVVILEELAPGTTKKFLGFVEEQYIKSLREIGHKLTNVAKGGEGGGQKGYKFTPEQRENCSLGHALELTPEHRAKIGESRKAAWARGVYSTEEAKENQQLGCFGREASAETRAKIGASLKAAFANPETRARLSAARMGNTNNLGNTASAETKAKMRASAKAAWARRKAEKEKI